MSHDPTQEPIDDDTKPAEPGGSRHGSGGQQDDRDYVDKDVSGAPTRDAGSTGEYDDKDVGDRAAAQAPAERVGEFVDKDVTSDDTDSPVRSFVEKDISD